jgi:hypothetical protein
VNRSLLLTGWFLLGGLIPALAQSYVFDYFVSPIRPEEQGTLAGNMGELRSNHFHGGLDIRTDKKTGLPVHAAAEGYVYRLKVSTSGYGNVLYMQHPNGYQTVYAHLERFHGPLADWVRAERYRQQSSEIELWPETDAFVYKQRDTIAYSGNSGGSSGPHLHFEIRDYDEKVLNPLKFRFKEFPDTIAPVIQKIALRPIGLDARVDHAFGTSTYRLAPPKDSTSRYYYLNDTPEVYGQIKLSVLAYDLANGTTHRNGVYKVRAMLDSLPVYLHNLESFTFDETRYINVHKDFAFAQKYGERFHRCYVAGGNRLGIYADRECHEEYIYIQDTGLHTLLVQVWDAFDQSTEARIVLRGAQPVTVSDPRAERKLTMQFKHEITDHILKVSLSKTTLMPDLTLHAGSSKIRWEPSYRKEDQVVYLWDLRKGLPDSATLESNSLPFHLLTVVPPGIPRLLKTEYADIRFDRESLYDTLYLTASVRPEKALGDWGSFAIGDPLTPLHQPVHITLRPATPPADLAKTSIYSGNRTYLSYIGGTWKQDGITAEVKSLGQFVLATDSLPPFVQIKVKTSKSIVCQISDNLSGIARFDVWINGQWTLMNYDHKTRLIWSEKLNETEPFAGELKIQVTDRAGNVRTVTSRI